MIFRALTALILCLPLAACSTPPKPVTLDGRQRVPVNTPEAMAAYLKPVETPSAEAQP